MCPTGKVQYDQVPDESAPPPKEGEKQPPGRDVGQD